MNGKYYIVETNYRRFLCVVKFDDNIGTRLKKYICEKYPDLKEEILGLERIFNGEEIIIKKQPKNYTSKYKISISGLNLLLHETEIVK